MWYKASSVISAIMQCNLLTVADGFSVPACPKQGNNILCHDYFPSCDGKHKKCNQSLRLVNEKGNITILYFDYYLSEGNRDGRIKRLNSTLLLLIKKYNIDETLMN